MNNENINFKELESALIKLYGKIEIIEELKKHRGDKFNIFSILKMERLEVNTHSAFIYELINPKGTHYQDDKYLKFFIDEVLKIEDFNLKNVKVGRETLTDAKRKIDFTIENDDYYIAIEMKIDARDQENQLSDYFAYTKKQNKKFTKTYYLTLDGKNASEKSFKNGEIIDYENISFDFHILNFIEKSIEKSANLSIIRESLIQYKNLILNITNQTTHEIQREVMEIIKNSEMAKAAIYMSNNLSYAWAKREFLFWKKLDEKLENYFIKEKLKEKGWEKIEENISLNNNIDEIIKNIQNFRTHQQTKKKEIGFRFKKDDFIFDSYSFSFDNFNYQVSYINRKKDIKTISEKIGFYNEDKEILNAKWKTSNMELNFSKDYNPTYNIFDDEKLDKIVEYIYNEIKFYMDIIIKELK